MSPVPRLEAAVCPFQCKIHKNIPFLGLFSETSDILNTDLQQVVDPVLKEWNALESHPYKGSFSYVVSIAGYRIEEALWGPNKVVPSGK